MGDGMVLDDESGHAILAISEPEFEPCMHERQAALGIAERRWSQAEGDYLPRLRGLRELRL